MRMKRRLRPMTVLAEWYGGLGGITAEDPPKIFAILRLGDRAVSFGERPFFDPESKSRREDLGLPAYKYVY
ncbi:hypothetical protein FN846DRAFT_914397 [Sphaerosporella brunnea]|uniref:Uncharacterized protein n=1 Tax=Sphaerosporella brunnea TaxID=1250544 RepID=A0A5J5EC66_9PEZI|nr:hypothetical protein FN846DRAFT_914397 [Sphaerosporella brunnea]